MVRAALCERVAMGHGEVEQTGAADRDPITATPRIGREIPIPDTRPLVGPHHTRSWFKTSNQIEPASCWPKPYGRMSLYRLPCENSVV